MTWGLDYYVAREVQRRAHERNGVLSAWPYIHLLWWSGVISDRRPPFRDLPAPLRQIPGEGHIGPREN